MIIMKFGGTSVGTAADIQTVLAIVRGHLDRQPVLVVSAHAGVTNALVDLSRRAPKGDADISGIEERHRGILKDLGLGQDLLDDLHDELRDLACGMKLVSEASHRAVDVLLSYGERCSVRTLAAYFNAQGLPARAVDAFEAGLRTDSNFGRARSLPDDGRIASYLERIEELPIVTGFLGRDGQGNITTLGRNGSDYSAALFGHALDAEEIQIWRAVDGVMTADPKLVSDAKPIPTLSFGEASELAYYGGKVLHPATILPAMEKSIPVRVLNTNQLDSKGTVILPDYDEPGVAVRAIVHKGGIFLINLVSPPMLQQHGFLARVFHAAAEAKVDLDLLATSEVSISMTADREDNLADYASMLEELGTVTIEPDHALICVVGQGIATTQGTAAKVLQTLAEADVRVRVISQGAIKLNIGLVIRQQDLKQSVSALHARFFS
ncbi:MAG: aspartate kinase [Planctomycetota bacterium]